MVHKEKIEALLATQSAANNTLAFILVKTQPGISTKEAILHILKYQIENFWQIETKEWEFEVNETQYRCYIFERNDNYVMDNFVDIYCHIKNRKEEVEKKQYLGEFDYNPGFKPNEHSPTLFNFKEVTLELFSATLNVWMRKIRQR